MKPINKAKGMALMEVLITMLVFALALVPLVKLQVLSLGATRAGFYKTETAAAAESMMDYLMTDVGAIFNGDWEHISATSGQECESILNKQQRIACEILNPKDAKFHVDGNAVLCVFGAQPKYGPSATPKKDRDQYLISIRAIWYSDKRDDRENYYNGDLTEAACKAEKQETQNDPNDPKRRACINDGTEDTDYCKKMDSNILSKENIDSIQIDMAY